MHLYGEIIQELAKLGDYLSVQVHKPCSFSHMLMKIGNVSELFFYYLFIYFFIHFLFFIYFFYYKREVSDITIRDIES